MDKDLLKSEAAKAADDSVNEGAEAKSKAAREYEAMAAAQDAAAEALIEAARKKKKDSIAAGENIFEKSAGIGTPKDWSKEGAGLRERLEETRKQRAESRAAAKEARAAAKEAKLEAAVKAAEEKAAAKEAKLEAAAKAAEEKAAEKAAKAAAKAQAREAKDNAKLAKQLKAVEEAEAKAAAKAAGEKGAEAGKAERTGNAGAAAAAVAAGAGAASAAVAGNVAGTADGKNASAATGGAVPENAAEGAKAALEATAAQAAGSAEETIGNAAGAAVSGAAAGDGAAAGEAGASEGAAGAEATGTAGEAGASKSEAKDAAAEAGEAKNEATGTVGEAGAAKSEAKDAAAEAGAAKSEAKDAAEAGANGAAESGASKAEAKDAAGKASASEDAAKAGANGAAEGGAAKAEATDAAGKASASEDAAKAGANGAAESGASKAEAKDAAKGASEKTVGGSLWTSVPAEEPSKPKLSKKKRIAIGVTAGAAAALLIGYFAGAAFYKNRFFANTSYAGVDISSKTKEEAQALLAAAAAGGYEIQIVGKYGENEIIHGSDINVSYDAGNSLDELLKAQEGKSWIAAIFSKNDAGGGTEASVDYDSVMDAVTQLECTDAAKQQLPTDASIDASSGTAVIVPDSEGTLVDAEKLASAVVDAVKNGSTQIDLDACGCYAEAEVKAGDTLLIQRYDTWNRILTADIVYDFGDADEEVKGSEIKDYIRDDGTTVTVGSDYIAGLVAGWAEKYDSCGKEWQFTTSYGTEATVPAGGDYGYCIDQKVTAEQLQQALVDGLQCETEAVWLVEGRGWDNGGLTGSYIEIDLAGQHLWAYKDYELVAEADVVTGLPGDGTETVPGCFSIDEKTEGTVLGGDQADAGKWIDYWLAFNGGQGICDASWLEDFGGSVYASDGSGGCVYVPSSEMMKVFNAASEGMAVVVYDDPGARQGADEEASEAEASAAEDSGADED